MLMAWCLGSLQRMVRSVVDRQMKMETVKRLKKKKNRTRRKRRMWKEKGMVRGRRKKNKRLGNK